MLIDVCMKILTVVGTVGACLCGVGLMWLFLHSLWKMVQSGRR